MKPSPCYTMMIVATMTSACTTINSPPTPESARLVVPAPANARTAVITAFTAEGLNVASATGDVIVSTPLELAS